MFTVHAPKVRNGANGEGRTPIPLREPDPKSGASANSATFAARDVYWDYNNPFSVPQTLTSSPIPRNIAAFEAKARLAPSASGAYATCMWLDLWRAIIWSRVTPY